MVIWPCNKRLCGTSSFIVLELVVLLIFCTEGLGSGWDGGAFRKCSTAAGRYPAAWRRHYCYQQSTCDVRDGEHSCTSTLPPSFAITDIIIQSRCSHEPISSSPYRALRAQLSISIVPSPSSYHCLLMWAAKLDPVFLSLSWCPLELLLSRPRLLHPV